MQRLHFNGIEPELDFSLEQTLHLSPLTGHTFIVSLNFPGIEPTLPSPTFVVLSNPCASSAKGAEKVGDMAARTAYLETVSQCGIPQMNLGGSDPSPQEHVKLWPISKDKGILLFFTYSQEGRCGHCLHRSTIAGTTSFQSFI
jgi:hypothetical protein